MMFVVAVVVVVVESAGSKWSVCLVEYTRYLTQCCCFCGGIFLCVSVAHSQLLLMDPNYMQRWPAWQHYLLSLGVEEKSVCVLKCCSFRTLKLCMQFFYDHVLLLLLLLVLIFGFSKKRIKQHYYIYCSTSMNVLLLSYMGIYSIYLNMTYCGNICLHLKHSSSLSVLEE